MRGEVGKKIPKKEMNNMTSQEDDVVQKLCILGFLHIKYKQARWFQMKNVSDIVKKILNYTFLFCPTNLSVGPPKTPFPLYIIFMIKMCLIPAKKCEAKIKVTMFFQFDCDFFIKQPIT